MILFGLFFVLTCNAQLIVNIRNRGDEVFQEAITSNISQQLVELEYQSTDGSLITQLIDFKHVSNCFNQFL